MNKESKIVAASTILTTAVVSGFTLSQGPIVLDKEEYKMVEQEVAVKDIEASLKEIEKTEQVTQDSIKGEENKDWYEYPASK